MLALAGCASTATTADWTPPPDFDNALWGVVQPSDATGGTLRVVTTHDCLALTPAESTGGTCRNVQRLLTRQLMAFATAPGREGSVTVPDLATGPGVPDESRLLWRYRVRSGVTWSDGKDLSINEVAAGVRALARRIPGLDVRSVTVTLSTTGGLGDLVVELGSPVGDLDSVLALPQSAPVHDGPTAWLGPYVIASASAGILERNAHWDAASDPVRRPLPDRIDIARAGDAERAFAQVRDGKADVYIDGSLAPDLVQSVFSYPAIASMADNPGTGRVTMLAVPGYGHDAWQVADCRRAVFSALDRTAIVDVLAQGIVYPLFAAAPATSLSAPTIASHDKSFEPFDVGPKRAGDLGAASKLVDACGPEGERPAVLAVQDTATAQRIADVVVASVARIGVDVEVRRIPLAEWVATTTSPDRLRSLGVDWVLMQRIAAIPGVWGYWYPLVSGDLVGREPSTNVAQVRIPGVDVLLDSHEIASKDPLMLDSVGRTIDRLTLDSARYIPLAVDKSLLARPAQLTNVETNAGLGNEYDLANIGVR